MPELPEVETIRRQLSTEIVGKKIVQIAYDTGKMIKPSAEEFKLAVEGKTIQAIKRRAKLFFFYLDEGVVFTTHLKLTGRLLYRPESYPQDGFVHFTFHFSDGSQLRFSDARKFGFMQLMEGPQQVQSILDQYGPEPLDDLDTQGFIKLLASTKRRIKDVLLDQSLISGIGNIYANDALWMAKIHPESQASSLTKKEAIKLLKAIEDVLTEALKDGGASDQWYLQIHGETGHYQDHFKVYSKRGESCPIHPDSKILYLKVSQRGSFFCPVCQIKNAA